MEINVIKTRRGCENQVVLSATLESRRLLETDLRIIISKAVSTKPAGTDAIKDGIVDISMQKTICIPSCTKIDRIWEFLSTSRHSSWGRSYCRERHADPQLLMGI